jgi:hypothetical protein
MGAYVNFLVGVELNHRSWFSVPLLACSRIKAVGIHPLRLLGLNTFEVGPTRYLYTSPAPVNTCVNVTCANINEECIDFMIIAVPEINLEELGVPDSEANVLILRKPQFQLMRPVFRPGTLGSWEVRKLLVRPLTNAIVCAATCGQHA